MTESKLYKKHIKPCLLKRGGFFERIDLDIHPDIYTCKNKQVLWIELKCINKRSKILKPDWRPGQLAWIIDHSRKGGDNILLCLWYINQYRFLIPSEKYEEFEYYGLGVTNIDDF